MIGHTKSDNRMDRCWLPGALGDALHALSCAAGLQHPLVDAGHLPNPSLKRSANGKAPGPGCGEVHSPQPGPGALPSSLA
jgi:hypothetical protein